MGRVTKNGNLKWHLPLGVRPPTLPLDDLVLIVYEDVPLHIHIQRLPNHPLKPEGADRLIFFELWQSFQ